MLRINQVYRITAGTAVTGEEASDNVSVAEIGSCGATSSVDEDANSFIFV